MLTIRCRLLRDTFEGGQADNPIAAEWPPSWMRLFSALVSVATPGQDDRALERLERLEPPTIVASPTLGSDYRRAYVPTNRVVGETKHATLPARINSERGWARVAPKSPVVSFHWPDATLDEDERDRLDRLCKRIPYLGRSTSPATIRIDDSEPKGPSETVLMPRGRVGEPFEYVTTVRCPYPGALQALRDAHHAKYVQGGVGDPWSIGLRVDYGRPGRPVTAVATSPYQQVVIFKLEGSQRDGRSTVAITRAFQRMLLSRAPEHIPALHGHDLGAVHIAVLGLPDVGHPYADGHLLGVAVALPDLSDHDLQVVAAALGDPDEELTVTAGPLGLLTLHRLSPLESTREAWGLRSDRWTTQARRWVTVLPMVFDRHLKRSSDRDAEIRRTVVNSGFPEPVSVSFDRRPMIEGGLDLAPVDTLRRRSDRGFRPYGHAIFEFPAPVRGPVVIGSMRHYGLGLCVQADMTNG